jgi:hypothetical protein
MNYLPYISSLLNVNLENITSLIICNNYKRYLNGKDFPKSLVPTICFSYSYSICSNIFWIRRMTCRSNTSICTNYQVQGYGQFKMHGSVINVLWNLNIIQLVLPRLLDNEVTFGLIIKRNSLNIDTLTHLVIFGQIKLCMH